MCSGGGCEQEADVAMSHVDICQTFTAHAAGKAVVGSVSDTCCQMLLLISVVYIRSQQQLQQSKLMMSTTRLYMTSPAMMCCAGKM